MTFLISRMKLVITYILFYFKLDVLYYRIQFYSDASYNMFTKLIIVWVTNLMVSCVNVDRSSGSPWYSSNMPNLLFIPSMVLQVKIKYFLLILHNQGKFGLYSLSDFGFSFLFFHLWCFIIWLWKLWFKIL
jgi:hypothetical protein